MAGTIPLSLTQQLDEFGSPLGGGLLYIIQAGTISTPQNAFQDVALSIPLPNPILLDAAGRVPQFFLADGQIKVRLQNSLGVVKFQADNLLVIGPSAGGGGGGGPSVDPTTVLQTGDIKPRYDTAIIAGFVRANGNTIGSAVSGASELADASAQPLFNFLWLKDPALAVTPGGRGASAAADWAAAKQIAVPDWRGCSITGLDDMGNTAAGRLTSAFFGVVATVLGAFGGLEKKQLATTEIPAHFHGAKIAENPHTHNAGPGTPVSGGANGIQGGGTYTGLTSPSAVSISPATTGVRVSSAVNGVDNTDSAGGGATFAVVGPRRLCTIYIKL